jgi:hypothetical protein
MKKLLFSQNSDFFSAANSFFSVNDFPSRLFALFLSLSLFNWFKFDVSYLSPQTSAIVHRGSSINDVTAKEEELSRILRLQYCSLRIKNRNDKERGCQKMIKNCVTSFMEDPLDVAQDKDP